MPTTTKATPQAALPPLERTKVQSLLLQNPNYFGTLPATDALAAKFKPVIVKNGDTTYEQITCIGYNPDLQELSGIVKINLNAGYNGGPCTAGSNEYVRFFINYGTAWQDLGVQSFNIHDIPHTTENPLDYAVNLHFVPAEEHCCFEAPVLPQVKAILSWSIIPPAGNPNYIPVWGNVLNVNIQIAPSTSFACLLKKGLTNIGVDVAKEKVTTLATSLPAAAINTAALKTATLAQKLPAALPDLVKAYGNTVPPERVGFTAVTQALSTSSLNTNLLHSTLATAGLDIAKIIPVINKPNYNTTYEEVKCVGLNRDASTLNATVNLKQSSGFSGGLCTTGSREYVAFYMDFGSGWVYMGTSSVGVHDITPLPAGGLSYNVELPVNLLPYQKVGCQNVYLAKVMAILSWNQLPPVNPAWVPVWGNMIQAWAEIRNTTVVIGGNNQPTIITIGTFPATNVDTNTGLLNFETYSGYSFTGVIPITGIISTPPDSNSNAASELKYRIMLKRASQPDSAFAPVTNSFDVLQTVITAGIPVSTVVSQVNSLGYYNYLVDYTPPTLVTVYGDLLGALILPDSDLYEFYLEIEGGLKTTRYRVKSDTSAPSVAINIDNGQNCGTLVQGNPVTGTYSIADTENNCLGVAIDFIYLPPGSSSSLTVDGVVQGLGALVDVPAIGKNGVWAVTTNSLVPCGYNIRLWGYDKTVVCYAYISYAYSIYTEYNDATLGFCLAKPPQ
ncbi:hypothetical protein HDF24_11065 [Mucilaginibacter sp. X4EP1]|uniref:hypothetical protein n=1 Tax=Mucilaginibacter sp. X4EP1 TaxID=2723092 RepID=UPI0021692255|nr:hypothetical protein [Mucilaginibacter sp. X4EP1]MCS3815558.1 hypothetical protein [Mucilaginibacter sp. X4EP1]